MICMLPQEQGQQLHVPVRGGGGVSDRAAVNAAATAATTAPPFWPEEVDIEDREGQDTVEIALVFELAPT